MSVIHVDDQPKFSSTKAVPEGRGFKPIFSINELEERELKKLVKMTFTLSEDELAKLISMGIYHEVE